MSQLATPYGILIGNDGMLELVASSASVVASVPISLQSVISCPTGNGTAVEASQVSTTADQVYFKSGDTQIRRLVPPYSAVDVTTVPGGPSTVSFFSVSPDDQHIAVVEEDFPAQSTTAPAVSIRLYVADLSGGGHRVDLYSATTPDSTSGTTLWPMGWHQGNLVLAMMPVCSTDPSNASPVEYHVSSSTTGNRIATIRPLNLPCLPQYPTATSCYCVLSVVPAPIGVPCVIEAIEPDGSVGVFEGDVYDWKGNRIATIGLLPGGGGSFTHTALSPSGNSIMFTTGPTAPPRSNVSSEMEYWNQLPEVNRDAAIDNYAGCLWIDEDHVLAPNAVLTMPAPLNQQATAVSLQNPGTCEGRFPGGL